MRRRSVGTSCEAGERRGRGDRHGLRAGGHAAGGGEPRRRRLHRGLPGRSAGGGDGRFPRDGAPGGHARGCTSTARGSSGRGIARGPGPRGCPARSAGWAWPTPGGASSPGPTWSAPRSGSPARASPSRPAWPDRSTAQLKERTSDEQGLAQGQRDDGRLADFPESVAAFARPDRAPWKAGDRLIQRDLAATLERIAAEGPDEFYTGQTAELDRPLHGGEGRADHRGGPRGLPGQDPAARAHHVPRPRRLQHGPALLGRHRRSARCSTSWSGSTSRPTAARPRGRCTGSPRPCGGPSSPGRTGWRDPDFVNVPVAELVSKAAADELARSIGDRATPSAALAPFPDPAAGIRPHDASLGHRCRRQRRGPDLHPGGQLRRQGGRGGPRVPAEQRDGGFQPDPRPHRHLRPDRHPGQPDRARASGCSAR